MLDHVTTLPKCCYSAIREFINTPLSQLPPKLTATSIVVTGIAYTILNTIAVCAGTTPFTAVIISAGSLAIVGMLIKIGSLIHDHWKIKSQVQDQSKKDQNINSKVHRQQHSHAENFKTEYQR